MSLYLRQLLITACFSFLAIASSQATHNRAGEITYVHIAQLTVRCTVTTYTKKSSFEADRDSVEVCWGDGTCEWVRRINGPDADNNGIPDGETIGTQKDDMKMNEYIAEHTFPGFGHYVISMTDPNRNGGILNVNPPNSINVPFHIQTTVTLQNPQFAGNNNSPVLSQPPIDKGCVGQPYKHNPGAFDPDFDSLSYRLIIPMQAVGTDVPNYLFPNQIEPFNNQFTINPVTGDILWDSPQKPGEYNFAFYVISYRNGIPTDTLIRDMQILIEECDNMPPSIAAIDEICVIAGETVAFEVTATDPDQNPVQKVSLTAQGGPFEVDISPAEFFVPGGFQPHPLIGNFIWETTCEHISEQFYTVVFRASDDHPTSLADLKIVRIKVVGPPPEDLQGIAGQGMIEINWESPYFCENAADEYFRGFSIWRREGSNPFPLDTCNPGIEGKGYTRLVFDYKETKDGRYNYLDENVERGRTYCYRVVGEFAKLSFVGQPFNRVQSLTSEEVCIQLSRDIPLMTNVDIVETNPADGKIFVSWSKPNVDDLDTIQNPGPYTYQLERATGITQTGFAPVAGATFTSPTFSGAIDTFFTDSTGLDTENSPYTYRVAFFVRGGPDPLGTAKEASSVFLRIFPTDNANLLQWGETVPWENFSYTIFRGDPGGTSFDSITQVEVRNFTDIGLTNGLEYCYFIKSYGSYSIPGIKSPLINRSQRVCAVPRDTIPPCPPVLAVTNDCDLATDDTPEEAFENFLSWTNPNITCVETDDVVAYNIYYAPERSAPFELIGTLTGDPNDTTLIDKPEFGIAGCYAVTAVDSFNNESSFSNIFCVENCPIYNLPNVFTPNDDGQNDLYIPFPYRFVERIDLKVFNRWGELVHETSDPDINWDGTNLNGKELAEGTYFYSCKVFVRSSLNVSEQQGLLKGYIELIRGR